MFGSSVRKKRMGSDWRGFNPDMGSLALPSVSMWTRQHCLKYIYIYKIYKIGVNLMFFFFFFKESLTAVIFLKSLICFIPMCLVVLCKTVHKELANFHRDVRFGTKNPLCNFPRILDKKRQPDYAMSVLIHWCWNVRAHTNASFTLYNSAQAVSDAFLRAAAVPETCSLSSSSNCRSSTSTTGRSSCVRESPWRRFHRL